MPRANTQADFWDRVNINGPTMSHMDSCCWIWTGAKGNNGYGQFALSGVQWLAHRLSLFFTTGDLQGAHVLHQCDNRMCVRPTHLRRGTNADNVADRVSRGRTRVQFSDVTHCVNEHPFSEENTYYRKTGRTCRTCQRERVRKWRDNQRKAA